MVAKQTAAHSWRSRFAHAQYRSQVIDRFLYWGDHETRKAVRSKVAASPLVLPVLLMLALIVPISATEDSNFTCECQMHQL